MGLRGARRPPTLSFCFFVSLWRLCEAVVKSVIFHWQSEGGAEKFVMTWKNPVVSAGRSGAVVEMRCDNVFF